MLSSRPRPVYVSIHAPVKGRPDDEVGRAARARVSIHAPVKGRPSIIKILGEVTKFQSTPP